MLMFCPEETSKMRKRDFHQRNGFIKGMDTSVESVSLEPKRKAFLVERAKLPISNVRQQLVQHIRDNPITIIVGETGSGKSTQIPQICLDEGLLGDNLVAVTQPRRVAAIALALRVASERNTVVGEIVGYKVRFENVESSTTRILYATDGILLREAFYDALLERYSLIILDEAHERSLHTDILFFVLKRCYRQRMNSEAPLKLIIMSATLEADSLSKYFFDAPVLMVRGRTYPVEIFYANDLGDEDDYVFNTLATVMQIHETEELSADVLVFLTGQEEIENACKKVTQAAEYSEKGKIIALPLYAALPPSGQMKVFKPLSVPNTRKVIFATNIAETSVTVPGVRIVIDCGRYKVKCFYPQHSLNALLINNISKAMAIQRAGRAAREGPGKCFRLYSEAHYKALMQAHPPEIFRINLSTVLLELYRIGMRRLQSLSLLENPSEKSLEAAQNHLRLLGAIEGPDVKGHIKITELGTKLVAFPIEPSFAHILLAASDNGCLEEALTVVSLMSTSEASLFVTSSTDREQGSAVKERFRRPEGDHCTMLEVYRGYLRAVRAKEAKQWCRRNMVNERVMSTARKVRKQLREICIKNALKFGSCGEDNAKLRWSLCMGLYMNACEYVGTGDLYKSVVSPNLNIKIHPSSCVYRSKPAAFIFSELVCTSEIYARDITVVDVKWVRKITKLKAKLAVVQSPSFS